MNELTILPDKWVIEWIDEESYKIINKHFDRTWRNYGNAWVDYQGTYHGKCEKNPTDYIRISIDQFKKWVLKIESEEDLLTKAKRLYPIGTKYKCAAGGDTIYTVESMNWYFSSSDHIYGEISKGCIYKYGKWAEIVDEVNPIKKWSVGSYVVFLTDEVKTNSGVEITKGKPYRINEKQYDLLYSKSDTKKVFNFFWEQEQCEWFATLEEAEAYSKSLIPVVELQPKDIVPEYVKYTNSNGWFTKGEYEIGKIYKWSDLTRGVVGKYSLKADFSRWTEEFEISSKSEYDAQQLVSVNREEYIDTTIGIKPSLAMSKDELLEYAKKKYPIGCKVKFPGFVTCIVSKQLSWQYKNLISHSGCCPVFDIKDGKYIWAEIIEMPKSTCVTYSGEDLQQKKFEINQENEEKLENIWNSSLYKIGIDPSRLLKIETHQLNNKRSKFSPIKVELIKVKQLKIN